MAITAPIIGTPVATFINGLATLEGIVVPAGVAVGDLLELHVSVVHTVGTPVDFTCDGFAIVGSNFRSIDDTAQVTIMHKVAVASDIGATYTMTATNAADVTGRTQAVIRVVPGAALPTNGDAVPGVNVTSTVTHAATVNFTEAGGWFAMTVGTRNGYTFSSATLTERVDFNDAGTNASLGVFDSNGAVATGNVSHTVTVSNSSSAGVRVAYALYEGVPANAAPDAVFTWSTTGLQGEFDATNSTDSDGTITEYAWDYGDGNTRTLAWHTNTHDYAAPGEYLVTLTVTDDGGATDTTAQTVTITAPSNTAPTVTLTPATIDDAEPDGIYSVTAAPADSDGTIASTTFESATLTLTGTGLTRSFRVPMEATAETHTITVTTTDDDGATDVATTAVNALPCDTSISDGTGMVLYVEYIQDTVFEPAPESESAPTHEGSAFMVLGAQTAPTMTTAKTNGATHAHVQAYWDRAQSAAGGPVDASDVLGQITAALNAGLKVSLEVALQYPPAFVKTGAPKFKDQTGAEWTGAGGSGDEVRDWVWSATGRGYVDDFLDKLFTQLPWENIERVRLGGLMKGELQYPNNTGVKWQAYSTAAQTGAGLAAGMSAAPLNGHIPSTGTAWTANDAAFLDWYEDSLNQWMLWYIAKHREFFNGRVYVMHPSFGLRPNSMKPTTGNTLGFREQTSKGVNWDTQIGAYPDANIHPYSTWIDGTHPWDPAGDPTAAYSDINDGNAAAWYHLLRVARAHGRADHIWGENTGGQTNTDMDRVFTQHALAIPGGGYEGLGWLSHTSLSSGTDDTYEHFAARVAANLAAAPIEGALYVGTESGDYTTYSAAETAAVPGDNVVFRDGYIHTGDLAVGKAITVRSVTEHGATIRGYVTIGSGNARVEGLVIDGSTGVGGYTTGTGVAINASSVELVNNRILNFSSTGVGGSASGTDALVQGNYIGQCGGGVVARSYGQILGNEIERIRTWNESGAIGDNFRVFGTDVTIRGNHCHGTTPSETGTHHVDFIQTWDYYGAIKNILVENNIFTGYAHQGLVLQNHVNLDSLVSGWVIRNNVFEGMVSWFAILGGGDNSSNPTHIAEGCKDMAVERNLFIGRAVPATDAYNGRTVPGSLNGVIFIGTPGDAGAVAADPGFNFVRNNIFVRVQNDSQFDQNAYDHRDGAVITDAGGNVIIDALAPGLGASDVVLGSTAGMWVDEAAKDFRLAAGSPAIGEAVEPDIAFYRGGVLIPNISLDGVIRTDSNAGPYATPVAA